VVAGEPLHGDDNDAARQQAYLFKRAIVFYASVVHAPASSIMVGAPLAIQAVLRNTRQLSKSQALAVAVGLEGPALANAWTGSGNFNCTALMHSCAHSAQRACAMLPSFARDGSMQIGF